MLAIGSVVVNPFMGTEMVQRLMTLGIGLAFLVAGCNVVTASGNIVSQTRDLGGFSAIDVGSGLAVEVLVEAGAEFSVVVEYDDNIINNVITRVEGETLIIEFDGSVNFSDGNRAIEVVMPRLSALGASGGAAVHATGTTENYTLDASGGAAVDAAELRAMDVAVDASGGAAVTLFASSAVTGDASGGAAVEILGSPATVNVETSGGAGVDTRG